LPFSYTIKNVIAEVSSWTISDVSAWLAAVQLPQYAAAFAQNEISGSILLDITLEDLDYMSVTVLGHRKTILKGVEDLRKSKRFTGDIAGKSGGGGVVGGGEMLLSKSMTISSSAAKSHPSEEGAKTLHWSQLEPLANSKVCAQFTSSFIFLYYLLMSTFHHNCVCFSPHRSREADRW
jgi:hypothetical protein